jgi:hypothetical protein
MQKEQKENGDGPATDYGAPRHHYVWCCETADTTMRPKGRALTPQCGGYSVYSSRHDLMACYQRGKAPTRTGWPNATCGRCGRKGRLNPARKALKDFTDKNEAKAYAYTMDRRQANE